MMHIKCSVFYITRATSSFCPTCCVCTCVYMCVHTLTYFCSQLIWAEAMSNLPIFVFLLALLGWFICRVIIDIANLSDSASVGLTLKLKR